MPQGNPLGSARLRIGSTSFSQLLPICEMIRALFLLVSITCSFAAAQDFDVIIKNGAVYDGTGSEAPHVYLAIRGDRIARLGAYKNSKAKTIVDASGFSVATGFINMLSWSTEALIHDRRSHTT